MGHNRKVLVYKDVNYGASKASATQNTAANPADLADGSVGIYGVHEAGATNLNKLVLITDGGSETAGFVPAASFVGKEVFIAQGVPLTAGGSAVRLSNRISLARPIGTQGGIVKAGGGIYVAPVRGTLRIGWNGTVGSSLNLPATIARGDDFIISLYNRNYVVAGGREPGQKATLSVQTAAGDTAYIILSKFVASMVARYARNPQGDQLLIDTNLIKILHNGTGAVFTTSATVAGVKGATTLTTSAAHGVTAGDSISLNGDFYVTVAGTAASTLVLDRPYSQATGTVLNANTIDITVAPTQYGLELVDNADFRNTEAAVSGIAQNATIKRQVLPLQGSGSNAEVVAMEKEWLGKKGTMDQITRYQPLDVIYSQVAGLNYDLYYFETQAFDMPKGDPGSVFKVLNYVICAFPSGVADSTNKNQSDFEDAMISLFGAGIIPAIS
jgi:hypothetical protein